MDALLRYLSRSWDGVQTCHRTFQARWSKEYPWLHYDPTVGLMFCLACKHFRKPGLGQGSGNFRLSTVREHCMPNRTVCCNHAAWQSALTTRQLQEANEKTKKEEENRKIAQQLLCCYNTLVKEAPMTSFVQDLELLEVRFLSSFLNNYNSKLTELFLQACSAPDISTTRRSEVAGWEYADVIEVALKQELVAALKESPAVSVVVDESTLVDTTQWMAVSFMYIKGEFILVTGSVHVCVTCT